MDKIDSSFHYGDFLGNWRVGLDLEIKFLRILTNDKFVFAFVLQFVHNLEASALGQTDL